MGDESALARLLRLARTAKTVAEQREIVRQRRHPSREDVRLLRDWEQRLDEALRGVGDLL